MYFPDSFALYCLMLFNLLADFCQLLAHSRDFGLSLALDRHGW